MLAIGTRPPQLPRRLTAVLDRVNRDGRLARIDLAALTHEQARELIGARADLVYEESGGNPFYLEQLARGTGTSARPGAEVRLAGLEVPPQVVAALTEELATLSGPAHAVLDAASVAGDPFELDLVAVAADMPEPAVLDALDE